MGKNTGVREGVFSFKKACDSRFKKLFSVTTKGPAKLSGPVETVKSPNKIILEILKEPLRGTSNAMTTITDLPSVQVSL